MPVGFLLLSMLAVNPALISAKDVFDYCLPSNQSCWPSEAEWNRLRSRITGGKLHDISNQIEYERVCNVSSGTSNPMAALLLENEGEGRCMQNHDCSKEKCKDGADWNIPEYSVEAAEESDIIEALKFANKHDIQVTVKTTGHSYAGSSTGHGSLLIWMRHYKKYGEIIKSYEKCGEKFYAALKLGGGQVWGEAYRAAGEDYHLIGGDCVSVSAAGGWLNGGGLSTSARLYGLGIDQVIEFEVITADGSKVIASSCENPDLFWALRGGGGGSFGVTTSVHYKLHPAKPFCQVLFEPVDKEKWIDILIDSVPRLNRRWGGSWTVGSGKLFFQGTKTEIEQTEFYKRFASLENKKFEITCAKSYFGARDFNPRPGGYETYHIANRLIPMDILKTDPERIKNILKWIVRENIPSKIFSYILGGKVSEIGENETAVNPVMRHAILQVNTFDERAIQKFRDALPDSGTGINHSGKNEPDWENQFWGSNRGRLEEMKKKWDPENRFNCWHCVGYISNNYLT